MRRARIAHHRPSPGRPVLLGFAALIGVGTVLLLLPISWAGRAPSIIEALFTATSAACITGLTVVDTATFWSPFGQTVILLLVQVGGIGIMVFASTLTLIVARRLSLHSRVNTAADARTLGLDNVNGLVLNIVLTVLVLEAITGALLFVRFLTAYDYDAGEAAWLAVFHAVSAFNNAGFALFSDSLMGFATDPFIVGPLGLAIVVGGFGFPVLLQLRREFGTPLHWSMNTKLVLFMSGVLVLAGWALIALVEWNNPATIGNLPVADRLMISLFHSVNSRTAGFNLVPVEGFEHETWYVMDILMFIGGGPAGTSGGIKVTTFGVLLFILLAELRGEAAVNIFGKRLSRAVHRQAITLVVLAAAVVAAGTFAIMAMTDYELDRVLFETISAFSTTGISTGITADLPELAQGVLIVLMYVGRIGLVTIGTTIALRERPLLYELPKERPAIG